MNIIDRLANLWRMSGTMTAEQRAQVQRVDKYKKAWDAYHGRLPRPLKIRPNQIDDNVLVNYGRVVVDVTVEWLYGQPVPLWFPADSPAQAWLEACLEANGGMDLWQACAINGAVCGTAFVKIAPPSAETAPYPRLIALDPALVDVTCAPDDVGAVTRYTITWPTSEGLARQVIERQGTGWSITDQRWGSVASAWETVRDMAWVWEFPPIVHCQNLPAPNEFWGVADLSEDVIGLLQSVNLVRSNTSRILKFHAHPKTWGKGFNAGELKMSVDDVVVLPNPDAELHNLEMQSNLGSSRDFAGDVEQSLFAVTRTPHIALGQTNVGQVSGVALKVTFAPLIGKTEGKRRRYGRMMQEVARRVLAMGGFGDTLRPVPQWFELLPGDPLMERQVALMDKQLGVSASTLIERLGFDPATEMADPTGTLGEAILTAFDQGGA